MKDWYDDNGDGDRDLEKFSVVLQRFSTLEFSGPITKIHWKELAIVLAEESEMNVPWAKCSVAAFLITERFSDNGHPRHDVPSAPELRAFLRRRAASDPPAGPPPKPCDLCRPFEGRWKIIVKNGVEVPVPCECELGKWLAKRRKIDEQRRIA